MTRSAAHYSKSGIIRWLRQNLFRTWFSALQTVIVLAALVFLAGWAYSWLILDAIWVVQEGSRPCADGDGACWPFLTNNVELLLFGYYPPDQSWRAYLSLGILLACPFLILKHIHHAWSWPWVAATVTGIGFVHWLLLGGLGLQTVLLWDTGGLLLTLLISVGTLAVGLPGGVALALARRSRLPIIRLLSLGFHWFFGSVPTIILFFASSVLLLLFLPPEGLPFPAVPDSTLLVFAAIAAVAYAAPIRAGLEAVPMKQKDTATSLGFGPWTVNRRIEVPLALLASHTKIVEVTVWIFLESSVLMFIGLLELFGVGNSLSTDSRWTGEFTSMALVTGAVYLLVGLSIRAYGRKLARSNRIRTYERNRPDDRPHAPFPAP